MDDFTDDATHLVAELWEKHGGQKLSPLELEFLNDALTAFFKDRPYQKRGAHVVRLPKRTRKRDER